MTSHLLIQHTSYETCPICQTLGTRKMCSAPACSLRTEGDLPGPLRPLLHPPETQESTQLPCWARPPSRPDSPSRPASSYSTPSGRAFRRPPRYRPFFLRLHFSLLPNPNPPSLEATAGTFKHPVYLPHGSLNPEQWRPLNRSSLGRIKVTEKRLVGVSQQTPAR